MGVGAISESSSSWFLQKMRANEEEGKDSFETEFANKLMSGLDSDGDGSLNADEAKLTGNAFNELDSDNDGQLSQGELEYGIQAKSEQLRQLMEISGIQPTAPPNVEHMANDASIELDSDGGLSLGGSGVANETFDELDLNQDGVVSDEELKQAMENGVDGLESILEQMGISENGGTAEDTTDPKEEASSMENPSAVGQQRRAAMAYQENMADLLSSLFKKGTKSEPQAASGVEISGLMQKSVSLTV